MRTLYRQIEYALLFEELDRTIDLVEAGVQSHAQTTEIRLAEVVGPHPEPELDGWDDPTQREYRQLAYAQTLYRSLFISFWAHLEQLYRAISRDLKEDLDLPLSERELAGAGVQRSMTYFRKVASLPVDLTALGWNHVVIYNALRNHFVHAGSNVDDAADPGRARKDFARLPDVSIEPAGEIVLARGFPVSSLRAVHTALHSVFRTVVERHRARDPA